MTQVNDFFGVSIGLFLLLTLVLVIKGAGSSTIDPVALHMAVDLWNEIDVFKTGIDLKTKPPLSPGGTGPIPSDSMTTGTVTVFAAAATVPVGYEITEGLTGIDPPISALGANLV